MCGGKKKKRKRMIRQMLNWNTDVVLAYNGLRAWRSGFCALACVSESHFAKPVL